MRISRDLQCGKIARLYAVYVCDFNAGCVNTAEEIRGSAVGSAEGVVLASGVAVGSAVISGLGSASGSVSCAAFSAFVSTVTDTGVSASSARALIGTALKISSVASRHARDFLSFFFIFLLPFKDFSI